MHGNDRMESVHTGDVTGVHAFLLAGEEVRSGATPSGPASGGLGGSDYICSGQPVSRGRSGFAVMARFAQWWYE